MAIGYVQDYIERRAEHLSKKLGVFGQHIFDRALGSRRSQLTIVTSDLKSYTAFADLSATVIQRRDLICAKLRAVQVVGMPGQSAVFLADEILSLLGATGESPQ